MSVNDVLNDARARGEAAIAAESRPHYQAVNAAFKKQKAALTRATNSRNPEKVMAAVVKAVREWRLPPFNGFWPDDWARWQNALDDALGYGASVDLRDIR